MTRPQRWVNSIQESSNNVPSAICSAALWGFKLFVFLVPAHVNNASNLLAAGLNLWKLIGCWIGAIMKTAICRRSMIWLQWVGLFVWFVTSCGHIGSAQRAELKRNPCFGSLVDGPHWNHVVQLGGRLSGHLPATPQFSIIHLGGARKSHILPPLDCSSTKEVCETTVSCH